MAITVDGNVIVCPAADTPAMVWGTATQKQAAKIIGAKLKTAGVAARMEVYDNTDATVPGRKKVDVELATINSFDGITGIEVRIKRGIFVVVTGVGATGYIYLE